MSYFDQEFLDKLEKLRAVRKKMPGATEEEIAQAEAILNVRFPAAYREFLQLVGNGASVFFDNADADINRLQAIKKGADEGVLSRNQIILSENDLIFETWLDHVCIYLKDIHLHEDPPVYMVMERDAPPLAHEISNTSFSGYVLNKMDMNMVYHKKEIDNLNKPSAPIVRAGNPMYVVLGWLWLGLVLLCIVALLITFYMWVMW